jgi:TonB family protein
MSAIANFELALAFLTACFAKSTIFLACVWAIAIVLRRHSSAALRHNLWAAAILATLALPIFMLLLPAWHSSTLGSAVSLWSPARANASTTSSPSIPPTIINALVGPTLFNTISRFVLLAWTLGMSLVLSRLFAGLARLTWISAHAKPLFDESWMRSALELSTFHKITRPVRLLQCQSPLAMPLTWGIFHPVIVLPSSAEHWPEDRRRIVLSHELAHIARHDWLLQICAELARAIYWFHPLVWLAAARVRQESERAADDAVLLSGVAPSLYASQLLDLARTLKNSGRAWSTALAIARPSNLERRFAAMLNPSLNRRHLSPKAKFLIPLLALCVLVPLAALRLPGQNLSGKFTGTILDPSGGAVPNATIVMTNRKANTCAPSVALPPCTVDMTTSDADGNFVFKALPAGEYEMKVLKPGFATYLAPQVVLGPGRDLAMTAKLNIGSINENVDVQAEGSAKSVGAAQTLEAEAKSKATRIRIGGNVEAAKVTTKVQPIYPESAKDAGVQGTVLLHAVVGMDGRPLQLQVLNSQINPDLARAAVEAVSQWRYQPTLLNGEPVEIDTTIQVKFSLAP